MDPDTARKLFHTNGTILCLNVPEGAEFGLDMRSWVIGPKFSGVKMIPPGPHFIYYSLPDQYSSPSGAEPMSFGSRLGFWVDIAIGDILVYNWDAKAEDFAHDGSPHALSEEDEERYRHGVRRYDFDAQLGAFDAAQFGAEEWSRLTSYISIDVLMRLVGKNKKHKSELAPHRICSAAFSTTPDHEDASTMGAANTPSSSSASAKGVKMSTALYNLPNYTLIPKRAYPPGSSPSEITKHSLDKTYLVSNLIQGLSTMGGFAAAKEDESAIRDLLGEIQFAYVSFLLGNSFEAFHQWKNMIVSICAVMDGIRVFHPALLCGFFTTLQAQLELAPVSFFEEMLCDEGMKGENFLNASVRRIFSDMADANAEGELDERILARARVFRKFFKKRFGISLPLSTTKDGIGAISPDTFNDDEYAPVVVGATSDEVAPSGDVGPSLRDDMEHSDHVEQYGKWEGDPEKKSLWEKLDMMRISDKEEEEAKDKGKDHVIT